MESTVAYPLQVQAGPVKLYDWVPAFDRLLQRLPQGENRNLRDDYIRVRGGEPRKDIVK